VTDLLLVGTGAMAADYVRALEAAGVDLATVTAVGRHDERARAFQELTSVVAQGGGVEGLETVPGRAIVATSIDSLAAVTRQLLERGCEHILVEKPGGLFAHELEALRTLANEHGARVHVAYNRRFYPAVDAARAAIEADGGLLSATFDFTELTDRVLAAAREQGVSETILARWGIANSSHVIDLFLHLAGSPTRIATERSGALDWHPSGAVFGGAGATETGALFSYAATWSGAGRWGLELTTAQRKLVLRPLESLAEQETGSFALRDVPIEPEPGDTKPGLVGEVRAFLAGDDPRLCTLDDALRTLRVTAEICGYDA
jgi:predicted dehydrogenase